MITPGRAGRNQPVRVDGLREANAALAQIQEATREVFADMIKGLADNVESRALERVPEGPTGDLKASIGKNIREDGLQAAIGSGIYYAKFVELGTSRTKKKPFLYTAFRTSVRDWRRDLKGAGVKIRNKVRRRDRWKK